MSGLTTELVKTVNHDYTDAHDQLMQWKNRCIFLYAGIQTTVIEELAKECDIRLLDIDEKCRNKLLSAYPSYSEYTIPANTYTGQTEDTIPLVSKRFSLLPTGSLPIR